ncbi:MAG: surface-adhesin E family protein [Flavisolibacter sp.]
MKQLILIAIISTIATKAFAQTDSTKQEYWNLITIDPSDSSLILFKSEPVSIDGNVIRIWSKVMGGRKTIDNVVYTYTESKNLWEFDCKEQSVRVISTNTYDVLGKLLATASSQNQPWSYIVPGSIGETMMKAACQLKSSTETKSKQ